MLRMIGTALRRRRSYCRMIAAAVIMKHLQFGICGAAPQIIVITNIFTSDIGSSTLVTFPIVSLDHHS